MAPPPPPPLPNTLPTPRAFLTNLLNTFSLLQPSAPNADSRIDLSLSSDRAPAKPLLLTLHVLFPNTLLPALDLLDRRLVTRLVYAPSSSSSSSSSSPSSGERVGALEQTEDATGPSLRAESGEARKELGKRIAYYVKSSAQRRDGRLRHAGRGDGIGATSYEVRTRGWSCSCAAFAFAAFNAAPARGGAGGVGYEDYDGYDGRGGAVDDDDDDDDDDEMLLDTDEGGDGNERLEDSEEWLWGGLMVEEDVPLCKHLLACVLAEHWSVAWGMIEEREVGREEMAGWAAGWGG